MGPGLGEYFDQVVNGPIIWPGDLDATLARHREPAEDGGERYVSVGGLPAAIEQADGKESFHATFRRH